MSDNMPDEIKVRITSTGGMGATSNMKYEGTSYTRTDIVDDLAKQFSSANERVRHYITKSDDLTKQLSDLREENAGLLAAHDAAAFVAALPPEKP